MVLERRSLDDNGRTPAAPVPESGLRYKINKAIDIESISDELAGFPAAVRVTEFGIIEVVFETSVSFDTRLRVTEVMLSYGARPMDR